MEKINKALSSIRFVILPGLEPGTYGFLLLSVTRAKRDAKIILPFDKNLLLGISLFVVVWSTPLPY